MEAPLSELQKTIFVSLDTLHDFLGSVGLQSPAIMIIGSWSCFPGTDVVRPRDLNLRLMRNFGPSPNMCESMHQVFSDLRAISDTKI